MYTIRAYYLQYCGSYAPHRRRQTPDAGHRTPDAGRWTMDAGPSTPYYKLTGELKILVYNKKWCGGTVTRATEDWCIKLLRPESEMVQECDGLMMAGSYCEMC